MKNVYTTSFEYANAFSTPRKAVEWCKAHYASEYDVSVGYDNPIGTLGNVSTKRLIKELNAGGEIKINLQCGWDVEIIRKLPVQ